MWRRRRRRLGLGLVVEEKQEGVAVAAELVALGGRGRHERGETRGLGLHAPELRLVRGARRVELGQRADQRATELRRVQLLVVVAGGAGVRQLRMMLVEWSAGGVLLVAPCVGERGGRWGLQQWVAAAMVVHIPTPKDVVFVLFVFIGFSGLLRFSL